MGVFIFWRKSTVLEIITVTSVVIVSEILFQRSTDPSTFPDHQPGRLLETHFGYGPWIPCLNRYDRIIESFSFFWLWKPIAWFISLLTYWLLKWIFWLGFGGKIKSFEKFCSDLVTFCTITFGSNFDVFGRMSFRSCCGITLIWRKIVAINAFLMCDIYQQKYLKIFFWLGISTFWYQQIPKNADTYQTIYMMQFESGWRQMVKMDGHAKIYHPIFTFMAVQSCSPSSLTWWTVRFDPLIPCSLTSKTYLKNRSEKHFKSCTKQKFNIGFYMNSITLFMQKVLD